MQIDFGKLLGFGNLPAEKRDADFSDETFGARLGAKVGDLAPSPTKGIDFKDDTLGARLGAKIGGEPN